MMGKMNLGALMGLIIVLVGTMAPAGAVCSNGIAGVESTSLDVCCVEECGQCGGVQCDPGANSTLTAADCCATEIDEFGEFCEVTGTAPCKLSTAPASDNSVCVNGQTGVQDPDSDVCCPLVCGSECGGEGCGTIPGVDGDQCCAGMIIASGAICSDTVAAPCVVEASVSADSNSTCSNGFPGYESSEICCRLECGQCGGAGCGNIPGLDADDCCSSTIELSGELCSVTGEAPCVVDPPEVTPSTCPNGLAGVQDASVCCAEACGQCGGQGCGMIAGTEGSSDCCSVNILATGISCGDGVVAPCVMVNGTYTNAPATAPVGGATIAPTAGSRAGEFSSMAPTMEGQTAAPTAGSRGGINFDTGVPTPAPTTMEDMMTTAAPSAGSRGGISMAPTGGPADFTIPPGTFAPGSTLPPALANGASTSSTAGSVVTFAAMAAGMFAIFAAVRN